MKELSLELIPWWKEKLNRFENINIFRVSELPLEVGDENTLFQLEDTKSLIIIPLVYDRTLIGFLRFDSVRKEKTWAKDIVTLLKVVGEVFVSALERRKTQEALQKSIEETEAANYELIEINKELEKRTHQAV